MNHPYLTNQPTLRIVITALALLAGSVAAAGQKNSAPTAPEPLAPIGDVIVASQLPELWFLNGYDADGDVLTYDLVLAADSLWGDVIYDSPMGVPEGLDSTLFACLWPIPDNVQVFWRVIAFDGQAHSSWSSWGSFWVDGLAEPPTPPRADFPNAEAGTLYEMMPTFTIRTSIDYDPFDTVNYFIEISPDTSFELSTVYELGATGEIFVDFNLPDSLDFGVHYYWRAVAADKSGLTSYSEAQDFWTWTLGDQNNSHTVDIADLILLVHYMFGGGPPSDPVFLMDLNGDCVAPDVADLVHLVHYMFSGGAAPRAGCVSATGLL